MFASQEKVQGRPIRLIAAACKNMGIGKNGRLPWTLPMEFQYLLDKISSVSRPGKKNLLVWGRICWFSTPENLHPIDNAVNVVLSKTIRCASDLHLAQKALAHPWCDLIYLTDIMADFDCDTFFPGFDRSVYRLQDRFPGVPDECQQECGIRYKFQVFKKELGYR
ncbi:zgc:153031 isoform X2 [Brienomyrus brachyistius]|uniref:zgc:153031 isoform X2 n=1 Tax=Brienomyrus brachyistius TaxID=42636 RepID=UPI0020B2E27C|nr:zgc:153031 isoform X2 [Brienomyrus brachyistius]